MKHLIPPMAVGSVVGASVLLLGRPDVLQLALGIFAITYAVYVYSGYKADIRFTPRAALPFGLVGGVFSALFGSGGFIYSIYVAGRLETPAANHFLTIVEGKEQLRELGRKVLWEGAQDVSFELVAE